MAIRIVKKIPAALKKLALLPRRIIIIPVKLYRKFISPLKSSPSCRFTPTCSEYAQIAIGRWGIFAGGALSLWRILRCNPFCRGGYDPVPERKNKKMKCGDADLDDSTEKCRKTSDKRKDKS